MKVKIGVIAISLLLLLTGCNLIGNEKETNTEVKKETKAALADVSSYAVYYGKADEKTLKAMKEKDLVIVEPSFYTKETIKELQKAGTKVYGYISVMETPIWDEELKKQFVETDYYIREGNKVLYPKWETYLMDLASPTYSDYLLKKVKTDIVAKGFDGVFFDTVEDIEVEFMYDIKTYKEQAAAFENLLTSIQKAHPSLSFIQGSGVSLFEDQTYAYMDALLWENFDHAVLEQDKYTKLQAEDLSKRQQKENFRVLVVSLTDEKENKKVAEQLDFLYQFDGNYFNEW